MRPGGLISDVILVLLSNSILPIMVQFLNPWYMKKLWIRKGVENAGINNEIPQFEANR